MSNPIWVGRQLWINFRNTVIKAITDIRNATTSVTIPRIDIINKIFGFVTLTLSSDILIIKLPNIRIITNSTAVGCQVIRNTGITGSAL
ncbi:hypothetical protein E2C01_002190 [Portunus trituberculatus]|uniref:Uncharacterized protein n=1 Tax=Portunus trituberculatus TaxID=210409 RepID=A0A5B7CJX3_PORTR|nr:hypothetical protein [Portunus trituberculatus]